VGVAAGEQVVAHQAAAQLACLDAHHRVVLRIDRGIAPEHVDRDGHALQPVGTAGQRLLDDELEKATVARRGVEMRTREDARELLADTGGVHRCPPSPSASRFAEMHRCCRRAARDRLVSRQPCRERTR
jgi:hypothetical protein